jgi:plastocyanin
MIPSIAKCFLRIVPFPLVGLAALAAGCGQDAQSTGSVPPQAPPMAAMASAAATPAPPPAATQSQVLEVAIDNFSFTPPTVTVSAGTTVTWVNHDDVPHTVTANDHGFSSKALDTDERYSRLFAAPGTYTYYCAVHPHMTGQVVVK